jgi:hypothetical protein
MVHKLHYPSLGLVTCPQLKPREYNQSPPVFKRFQKTAKSDY